MGKIGLGCSVYDASVQRIRIIFDDFAKIYVSFSGGKDSTVMLHLAAQEARRRNRRIGVLFVDLEGQYKLTIEHISAMLDEYSDCIDPYWVCLPLSLRNAVSVYQPRWQCWDPEEKDKWIRNPPKNSITDEGFFPFFRRGMEFEEFIPEFAYWYGGSDPVACLVGIRADESLNRYRTITSRSKGRWKQYGWSTRIKRNAFNFYPVYDWKTKDLWVYHARYGGLYNKLYDRMHQAGLTIHQMRICQPYGDDQRRGLWLFHIIEPETWARIVARVAGANQGALYAQDSGNILGMMKITKPEGHSWRSFSHLLLESMPEKMAEHYRNKIAVFLKWYELRGYDDGIPDDGPLNNKEPSWKRICKTLLRNDYWCKGLSFSQTKSDAYHRYQKIMKNRRSKWKLI